MESLPKLLARFCLFPEGVLLHRKLTLKGTTRPILSLRGLIIIVIKHLVRAIFPALWARYIQFLEILIGSSRCLLLLQLVGLIIVLVLVIRQSLENRSISHEKVENNLMVYNTVTRAAFSLNIVNIFFQSQVTLFTWRILSKPTLSIIKLCPSRILSLRTRLR